MSASSSARAVAQLLGWMNEEHEHTRSQHQYAGSAYERSAAQGIWPGCARDDKSAGYSGRGRLKVPRLLSAINLTALPGAVQILEQAGLVADAAPVAIDRSPAAGLHNRRESSPRRHPGRTGKAQHTECVCACPRVTPSGATLLIKKLLLRR